MSAPKSVMCTDRIHALGRVVSHSRIAPDVDYLLQLENVPYPKNLADLRSFLGALNWVRDFLPGIAAICSPLTDAVSRATNDPASSTLSRKGKKRQALTLSQEERCAFDRCMIAVRSAVAVDLIDPDVPLIVYVDACETEVEDNTEVNTLQLAYPTETRQNSTEMEFLVDTGATHHIVKDSEKAAWTDYAASDGSAVKVANGQTMKIIGRGSVTVRTLHLALLLPRLSPFEVCAVRISS